MIMTGTLHYTQNDEKKTITRAMRLDSGTMKENCEKLGRWLKVRAIVELKKTDEFPTFDYCEFDILLEIDPQIEIEI